MAKIQVGATRKTRESEVIPESKPHADPQPSQRDWSKLHINGQAIPEELWAHMRYGLTDEGIAEKNEREGRVPSSGIRVTRDRDDKRPDEYRDGLKAGKLVIGQDPLGHMMKKHLPVGMAGLWMSAKTTESLGLVRGVLEYEPVLVDDPDNAGKKKRVTQNGMFLAMVPQELKNQADAYYASLNAQKAVNTVERVREHTEQVMVDGGLADLARKKRQTGDLMGIEVDDNETADAELARDFSEALEHEVVT